ncbi:MAG: hypothetical protein JW881_03570 [Spirochaetales bacterium]|nr:hypothetical protein [Spirochaetales bacterium]
MKRVHLFEFMDLRWYPDALRVIQTNILQVIMRSTRAFDYAVPYITKTLDEVKGATVVDLCSGASGPWLRILERFPDKKINVILTDKYPNTRMFERIREKTGGRIDFSGNHVDAMNVPAGLKGVRTIFTGFHHFRRNEVRRVIEDARNKKQAICVFDYVPDKILTLILFPLTFIISILQFWFLSFFVRPLTFKQILFTNIIPVVPLTAAWDGFVSAMRKYGADELREITGDIGTPDYRLSIGRDYSLSKAAPMTWLIGVPVTGVSRHSPSFVNSR